MYKQIFNAGLFSFFSFSGTDTGDDDFAYLTRQRERNILFHVFCGKVATRIYLIIIKERLAKRYAHLVFRRKLVKCTQCVPCFMSFPTSTTFILLLLF